MIIIDRDNSVYKEELFDDISTGDDLDTRVTKLMSKPVEGVDLLTDKLEFASAVKRGKLKFEQVFSTIWWPTIYFYNFG